jgi:hypothetical protein
MRRVIFLLLASSLAASSQGTRTTSPRRHLQDFHLRRLSSDSNDSGDSDESDDDDVYSNNVFAQAKDHVEQDFLDMWSISPSEWSQEYWEVFVGLLSLVIVGGLCVCLACIVPICFPGQSTAPSKEVDDKYVMSNETSEPRAHHDNLACVVPIWPPGQTTAPSKEVDDNNVMSNETSEPGVHHDNLACIVPIWFPGKSTAPSKDLDGNNVMSNETSEPGVHHDKVSSSKASSHESNQPILEQPMLDQPILDHGTEGTPRSKNRPKRKISFWSDVVPEVVSVWREFFADLGLFKEGSHYNQPHRKHKERHVPDASAREASSHNKYKAPSSRKSKKQQIEYDTASNHEENPPYRLERW